MKYESDACLSHYGIEGQKWGVRRFQYDNGSYTPEGKKRYNKESDDRAIAEHPKLILAKNEIENSGLAKRFKPSDIDHYSRISNKRFRDQVLSDMRKDSRISYEEAYKKRSKKNIGLLLGLCAPLLLTSIGLAIFGRKATKTSDALKQESFNQFLKYHANKPYNRTVLTEKWNIQPDTRDIFSQPRTATFSYLSAMDAYRRAMKNTR